MQIFKSRTIDAALGKWTGILLALGIDEKFLKNKHGPCPICKGVDRYRYDDKDGKGTFYCSGCGAGGGIDLLIRFHGWTYAEACKNIDSIINNITELPKQGIRSTEQKIAYIKKILSECSTVKINDPVWLYLNRRTGIDKIPNDIKIHKSLYHSDGGAWPAMVSIMRDENGKGVSIHRTYLTSFGEKAPVNPAKKFCEGLPLNGSSVRLSKIQKHIGIAEGIENALAGGLRFSIPTWAATNATLMSQWKPPEGIEIVTILGDNDFSFTGHSAAYSLAKRLKLKGLEVNVKFPDEPGCDWSDACEQTISERFRSTG